MTQRHETLIMKLWRCHSAADPHTCEQYSIGLGEQMHNGNEVTQRCPQIHIRFTNLNISILLETRETIPCTWSLKVSLMSNFAPRMSWLVLTRMETTHKTKSPWREITVLDLFTTKALVLLGFSFMHQWLHRSWILAKSLLRKAATAALSASLRTTVSSVESSA